MEDIDKELIAKKVYEVSKDSDYFKKQQAKTERAKAKGKMLKQKIEHVKKNEKLYRQKRGDGKSLLGDLERTRDLTRTWYHIDMDMFYAAVEIRDNPKLAEFPIAIGDMMMVATANYVARKYGVRSAMPGFIG